MTQQLRVRDEQANAPNLIQFAVRLHREGQLNQAANLYTAILATQPNNFDALHLLGVLRYRQYRFIEALHYIDAALKLRPTHVAGLSNLGLVQAGMGNHEKALASYDKALGFEPDYVEALNNRGNVLLALKRPEAALASYEKALAHKPDFAEAFVNRGNTLALLKRFAAALASYDDALALRPDLAAARVNRGNALLELRRPAEALVSFDKALACKPDIPEALLGRGNALRNLDRREEALRDYERALAQKADYAEAHNNRGNLLLDLKRGEEALASFDRALALKPDYAEAHNGRGDALADLGRDEEALASFGRAIALKPDYADALNGRGNVLRNLNCCEEALASIDRALAFRPDCAEAHNNRGNVLRDLDCPAEALASYEKALALKPDYAIAYDNKGVILTELGRLDEARLAAETAIKLAPRRVRTYYNLTIARRMVPGDPHLPAMEELARDVAALPGDERIDLHFALGKAYTDLGDHEQAFRHLVCGNALKRKSADYDEAFVLGTFARTQAVFTADLMRGKEGAGHPSAVPLFILGMPRSGSTLVEQILASHPNIFGAGEINDFSRSMMTLGLTNGGASHFPDGASLMSPARFRQLGENYIGALHRLAPAAARITNKTLENFRFLGLIHLALPNARIIHTRRDPIDTCLSCFSKLFVNDLPYAYDLAELGRYYRAYETLMAHWRNVLPQGVMLDVQYEELVADLEGQARRIVAHCGLEWDARCRDFHKTERSVRTASVTEVRQPIYQSSVGRWRASERFLGPLLAELSGTE